jgi:hypothetical protein
VIARGVFLLRMKRAFEKFKTMTAEQVNAKSRKDTKGSIRQQVLAIHIIYKLSTGVIQTAW